MKIKNLFSKYYYVVIIFLFITSLGISYQIFRYFTPEIYNNPGIVKESKIEIALIYIGCSTCGAANDPYLPAFLNSLSDSIKKAAGMKNYEYMIIGISSEQKIEKGLKHLEFIGLEFDEISLGNGLGNNVLQKYIWENYEDYTSAGVPQLLIVKREYDSVEYENEIRILPGIIFEQILYRSTGIFGAAHLIKGDIFTLIE